jgi:hypothetical protein
MGVSTLKREDADTSRGPVPSQKQDRRRLPLALTGLLPPDFNQGLDHVIRRRILRALHVADAPLSSARLSHDQTGALADVSLSTVAYHMKVLVKYGMVEQTGTRPIRGALERFFGSTVADNPVVLSVLSQTEGLDAPKRAGGGEG